LGIQRNAQKILKTYREVLEKLLMEISNEVKSASQPSAHFAPEEAGNNK